MKKLSLVLAALLSTSPAWAAVQIIVVPDGKTATIKYATTTGEKVRAFALDITVNKGVILGISDFIRGESTAQKPGYGIFPGSFRHHILVNPDTGEVATWDVNSYTPVADPCDYPSDSLGGKSTLGGLGTNGITIEMGALYYPTDDSSPNAPLNQGTLFKLTLSEPASLTVKLNEARGGIVLTNPDAVAVVDLTGAVNISIASIGNSTSSNIAIASSSSEYAEWVAVGKPICWTYPRQCHGDADGLKEGSEKTGFYYVGLNDLGILRAAWQVKEPPFGPGIATVTNGICADFAHDQGGSATTGFYRVGSTDLNRLVASWMVPDPGVPGDCGANLKP
jgi:hypothetical protein